MAGAAAAAGRNWDIVHFIQVIEEYDAIWNKNHADYRCRGEKARAWSEVCSRINEDYPLMKPEEKHEFELLATKKWFNLRDAFIKAIKLRISSNGRKPPYRYEKYMKFLGDIYEFTGATTASTPSDVRSSTSKFLIKRPRMKSESDNDEKSYFYGDDEVEEEQESADVFADIEADVKPSSIVKNVDVSKNDDVLTVLSGYLQREEDEDRLFLKSIESMVKRLPHSGKMQFRIEVMNLLVKLHEQHGVGDDD